MTHASHPAAADAARETAARGQENQQTSIFVSVLEALHGSRRFQAQRILGQYRHLIAEPREDSPHHSIPNGANENALAPLPGAAGLDRKSAPRSASLDPDQHAVFNAWAKSVATFCSLLIVSALVAVWLGAHLPAGANAVAASATPKSSLANASAPMPGRSGK